MRVLVIEDDKDLADFLAKELKVQGHIVEISQDGREGLYLATSESFDVLVVDRMLPNLDGLTIIKTLRGANDKVPVLILSALGEIDDRVIGLKSGGDDYLVKPFAFSELLARLEVLQRRRDPDLLCPSTTLFFEDLEMNLLSRKVKRGGIKIELQSREFKLLEYLIRHKGQVVTRAMLLENVWNYHFDPQTNVIDVHISRLRSKIDKDFETVLIHTVRGAGYIVEVG
jgi:two-component system OmpR family response regulator